MGVHTRIGSAMSNTEQATTIETTESGLFGMILFFVFLVLKLTHVIDWSWWWITAPLWGGFVICLTFLFIFLAFLSIFRKEK